MSAISNVCSAPLTLKIATTAFVTTAIGEKNVPTYVLVVLSAHVVGTAAVTGKPDNVSVTSIGKEMKTAPVVAPDGQVCNVNIHKSTVLEFLLS